MVYFARGYSQLGFFSSYINGTLSNFAYYHNTRKYSRTLKVILLYLQHRLPLSDCTELCSNVEVEHDKHPKPGYVKFNLDIECDLREDPSDRLHGMLVLRKNVICEGTELRPKG